jgi:hypothetical protein
LPPENQMRRFGGREPLQSDANASAGHGAHETKPAPGAGRLALRLVVGSALLAVESTARMLRRLDAGGPPDQPTTNAPTPLPPPAVRHVLIGALTVGPEFVSRQMTQLVERGHGALGSCVRRASRPLRFATRLLPTDELRRWSHEVRVRAGNAALNLAEVGRHEERIARTLAGAAAKAGMTDVLDYIANSPQVQSVIREQSAGMGRSALGDLRAQSARADAIAESLVGHLLPHSSGKNTGGSGSR